MIHQISDSRPFSLKIMMNDMKVCVQEIDGSVVGGCICHCCLREPLPFRGMGDMVLKIDALCDWLGFPEANPPRRILGTQGLSASGGGEREETSCGGQGQATGSSGQGQAAGFGVETPGELRCYHEFKEFALVRGEKFSFYIKMRYRENASWQGSIHFSGDVKMYQFRSVLELLGYIMEKTEEFQKGGEGYAKRTFNR